MEANRRLIYDDIIKTTDVQYVIPVYQRNYTWDKDNCNQLYDDIIFSIKNNRNHYIGSLVYSKPKNLSGDGNSNDIKICPIIDGQQRLTTVMLLLKAIHDSIDDENNLTRQKIDKNLYNELCEERYKLKLKNAEGDNNDLEKVLSGNIKGLNPTSKITINYKNFIERIEKSKNEDNISCDDLLNGIGKLEIVEIKLDPEDDPQKIFESINSTGKNLTKPDLIRNFLLMGITDPGKQKEAYTNYWVELENNITSDNIEKFFYDFLIMKDTRYINEEKVYENFKEYYRKVNNSQTVFEEIIEYGEYYKLIVCNDSKYYSPETNNYCKIFGILQHNTIYSFLLNVCKDYKDVQKLHDKDLKDKLSKEEEIDLIKKEDELNNILKLFNNYALRRIVCEVPSSSLRRFYASLYEKVFGKNKNNKRNYFKALESYLCTLKTDDAMPTNSLFKESLKYKNIYKKARVLRFFFDLIENPKETKEKVDMTDLTIEHYMPQTLSMEWQKDLGDNYQEIYDKYVHTLGNLSITGYNSEYSNDRFINKKTHYKNYLNENKTKIIRLNEELDNPDIIIWNEQQIENRADRLTTEILKTYDYPGDVDKTFEFEKFYEYYLDSDTNADEFENDPKYKLYGFMFEGVKYRAKYYKDIYVSFLSVLYDKNPDVIQKLAEDKYTFEKGHRINFSTIDEGGMTELRNGIYAETRFSRWWIFWMINYLMNEYQLDTNAFCILYIDK